MKKIIKRFWGVGLVIIILSSLFVAATPVSAAEALRWESKTGGPSTTFFVLTTKTVYDFAMSADAKTVYAACGATLMQSTNGGASSWTDITSRLPAGHESIKFVAMAPDDANTVVVVSSNTTVGWVTAISVNGGVTFTDMSMTTSTTTTIKGVEVSPLVTGGFRYVAAYGQSNTSNLPVLYYFNYGSGVGAWRNSVTYWTGAGALAAAATIDTIEALAFSPNFASDYMAVALSEQVGGGSENGTLRLHALTFNTSGTFYGGWDAAIAAGYPVAVTAESANASAFTVNSASLALGPDYMGGDESLRMVFVGADISGVDTSGGIWRCSDVATARKIFTDAGINSVAYDGTNLIAGSYATNNVYHCADPLAASPTVIGARSYKRIGVDDASNDLVNVMFVGETAYASKIGKGGAISKSTDAGNTWNDYTLINQAITNIDDIMVSADGATWYVSIRDTNTSSIYRMSPLQRVLCTDYSVAQYEFKLRGVAADANVVYAYDYLGTTLFYSADGGVSRWQQRLNVPAAIADMAVESANVIYFGSDANIYKSINNGFTWNTPVNTTGSSIYSVLSLGENKLVIGTNASNNVLYSTDGGTTWTRLMGIIGATNVQVAATGLASGDFIFAAPSNSNQIYRFKVGTPGPGQFDSMNLAAASATEASTGLMLTGGVLYAISTYTTGETYLNSLLTPTVNPSGYVPTNAWRTRYNSSAFSANLTFAQTPTALKTSTGTGKITLWAIDISGSNSVKYYDDTLATVGPKINAPNDKALVQTNSVTGLPLSLVLMWMRPSLATSYDIWVSTDTNFDTIFATSTAYTGADGTRDQMSMVLGTGGSTYYNPGTTYYWRVRANTPITSAWSEIRSFTIQPLGAAVPGVSSPANGSTISNQSPAFSWSPVTSTTKYEFQLSTTPTFGTTVLTDTPASAGTLVPVTIKLEQGKQYFWRVRALEPVQGDWSTVANFVVAVPAPATTAAPPVVITQIPAPVITIPAASPVPAITLKPADVNEIAPTYIWAIIIIGAILVIAVIVLIVRTRRSV